MCDESRGSARLSLRRDERVVLAAPTQVWSASDGSMDPAGAHGLFHGDWRYARAIEVRVDGRPVAPVGVTEEDDWTVFRGQLLDASGRPAPRVMVERMRQVDPGALVERVTLVNGRDEGVDAEVQLVCEVAFAPAAAVRAEAHGDADGPAHAPALLAPAAPITLEREGDEVLVTDGTRTLRAASHGGHLAVDGTRLVVTMQAHVAPDDWAGVTLELDVVDPTLVVHGSERDEPGARLRPTGRPALDRWGEQALANLHRLLLDAGHGAFPAAGAPWHLTLVARDALIACRLLLPLGGELAEGTLRTLAARQGVRHDATTGEEPGRILHELRQGVTDPLRPGVEAPPVFAGSVDPTPLWIVLLHDAWQAGLPLETVRELRTALHSALGWMAERTGDGFLTCPDEPGMGVTGKGAHAIRDGLRFDRDEFGVATAQVQALACRAAVGAASLLDALGDDGDPWRAWAESLRVRFREHFWVEHDGLRFPAMALDAHGRPEPTLTSDVGQLIGTTLLTRAEEAEVATLLLDPRLSSGFGLRTMATDAERYWPLARYCGAIWPHDTAITIEGLLRAGMHEHARALAEQLERAADAFDGRLPEVYSGYGSDETPTPIPYPGARGPQAWSAASVVPVHTAIGACCRPADGERPRLVAVARPAEHPEHTAHAEPTTGALPISINGSSTAHGPSSLHARAHLHLVPSTPEP